MKTTAIAYSNFSKVVTWTIAGILVLIALATFILAATGDTTPLGDPYYEDTILAPNRAYAPWALALVSVTLSLVLAATDWWQARRS